MNVTEVAAVASCVSVAFIGLNTYLIAKFRNAQLAAELKMAQMENSIIERLNGTYVRRETGEQIVRQFEAAQKALTGSIAELRDCVELCNDHHNQLHSEFVECRARHSSEHKP